MTDLTRFVGLDVHKKTISVALVEGEAGVAVRFYGTIANTPETVRTLCRKLSKDGQQLHFCYEGGAVRLRCTAAAHAAGAPLRRGGAGADPAQSRRPGEDGSAGCDDAGADATGWTADRGVGAGRGARSDAGPGAVAFAGDARPAQGAPAAAEFPFTSP